MSAAVGYTCCSECGSKLHTTFFCLDCGQPSCSLDCYCRHQAMHAETLETTRERQKAEVPSINLAQSSS